MTRSQNHEVLPRLSSRAPSAHKGDFGHILVIAGSRGLTGAAVLAGEAALRGGSGLVTVASPSSQQPIVASKIASPCMTAALPEVAAGALSHEAVQEAALLASERDVVALGPGLGAHSETRGFVVEFVARLERPCVLDADGLNAFAEYGSPPPRDVELGLILTPHPGEMARLCRCTTAEIAAEPERHAQDLAQRWKAVVVLKGATTIITDGERSFEHSCPNPGLATGGTGDVLTGLTAALLGQGLSPLDAARLGVQLHSRAGVLARDRVGEVSMTAEDVLDRLSEAIRGLD